MLKMNAIKRTLLTTVLIGGGEGGETTTNTHLLSTLLCLDILWRQCYFPLPVISFLTKRLHHSYLITSYLSLCGNWCWWPWEKSVYRIFIFVVKCNGCKCKCSLLFEIRGFVPLRASVRCSFKRRISAFYQKQLKECPPCFEAICCWFLFPPL